MDFVHDPVQINVGDTGTLNANKNITQNIMVMSEFEKEKELFRLLQEEVFGENRNIRFFPLLMCSLADSY